MKNNKFIIGTELVADYKNDLWIAMPAYYINIIEFNGLDYFNFAAMSSDRIIQWPL